MARKRRKRDSGLVELALSGPWPLAAILAVGMLILANVILPPTIGSRPFTAPMANMFQTLLNWGALIMGGVAAIKYLLERKKSSQASSATTNRQSITPSTAAITPHPIRSPAIPTPNDKPTEWSLALLQSLEWKRFEDLCAAFYQTKGIRCAVTPLGPDGGIDIRLFQGDDDRTTTIVQCKAWPEQKVGIKLVRELLGVKVHEKAEKAFFMTCGSYTEDAIKFAKANQITLFTGDMMVMVFKHLPQDTREKLLAFATAGDYTTPTCPSCGLKMVKRESKRGSFWGCQSYPKCCGRLWMRSSSTSITSQRTSKDTQ